MNNIHKNSKRVLFVSRDLIAADISYQLQKEGCDVKLCIDRSFDLQCFEGIVTKSNDWRNDLTWVGKDGLIVFDDVGYGDEQDALRSEGYLVVGGSAEGDRLELDREYGQRVMRDCGITFSDEFETITLSVDEAISFIKERRGQWVLKKNNHDEFVTYIGEMSDGSDLLNILANYKNKNYNRDLLSLQRRIFGVEIAVGRFFNGNDWVGPIVFNVEHKHFCNDDIGPMGGETGTVMWYDENEDNRLFQSTLAKLREHLKKHNHKGYVDINCIVSDEHNVYPLEITSRFGSSTNETQSEIHLSQWSEIFLSIAKGEQCDFLYKKGFAVNVALTVPPFPYITSDTRLSQKGVPIFFHESISQDDFAHIHFEEVMMRGEDGKQRYFIAGDTGYVLYITQMGDTVEDARQKVYDLIKKIVIPKVFYRTDIGLRVANVDLVKLKEWHWL